MMKDLGDIWDDGTAENSTTWNNAPLFLPDQPQDLINTISNESTRKNTTELTEADLNKLFDDDDFRVIPTLDDVEITRQANAKYARYAIESPMPSDPLKVSDSQIDGPQKGKKGRVVPKLDNEKLLGKDGLLALIRETRNFKVSEKGREDLSRLLYLYQLWGHKMFPKLQFKEMIERVEKLCHKEHVMRACKGYREAEKKFGENVEDGDVLEVNVFPDSRDGSPAVDEQAITSEADVTRETTEDFDTSFNAMFEEMSRTQGTSERASSSEADTFGDIDALINAFEETEQVANVAPLSDVREMENDEEMWAIVREMEEKEAENRKDDPLIAMATVQEDSDDDLYVND